MYPQIDFMARLCSAPEDRPINALKFGRVYADVYPLSPAEFPAHNTTANENWEVCQIDTKELSKDTHLRSLAIPKDHRIQENAYCDKDRNMILATEIQDIYDFYTRDKRSPIESIRIALHNDAQISIVVFMKVGVTEQILNVLSNGKITREKKVNPNSLAFNFAPMVGCDPVPRANILVRCDNRFDVDRVHYFLAGLHRITPFNQKTLWLFRDLMAQCYAQLNTFKSWTLLQKMEAVFPKRKLPYYSNLIPDDRELSNNYYFHPNDILNFPEKIPDVHLAVLAGDVEEVKRLLNADPTSLYTRDPWGKLPIEVAVEIRDCKVATLIYLHWNALNPSEKILRNLFIHQANKIFQLEFSYFLDLDLLKRQQAVEEYFQRLIPQISKADEVYRLALADDEAGYQKFIRDLKRPWEELREHCDSSKKDEAMNFLLQNLPEEFALFKAVLIDDRHSILAAFNDFIPNTSDLEKLLQEEKWDSLDQMLRATFFNKHPELKKAVFERDKEPAINPDVKNIRVVAGHNDLAILDEDKNGRIDAHDASFHYLYLLIYYQGGDKYRIIPVGHTGIRALFLKLEYMQSPSKTKKGDTFNDSVSQKAIMSDNSHRIFDSIKIEKELIDSIQKIQ